MSGKPSLTNPSFVPEMSEVLSLTQAEIRALLDLIEFHDDWDEVSEIVGVDVHNLYHAISALVTY